MTFCLEMHMQFISRIADPLPFPYYRILHLYKKNHGWSGEL
jgi:hypothetical protein